MNVLAIIPARSGSKGIKDKNIYPICGKPLIDWTCMLAKELYANGTFSDYVISTDYEYILDTYNRAEKRPATLCQDDTPMIDVIKHCISNRPYIDAVCLLQPTSPLRTLNDVLDAVSLFEMYKPNSLYSGYYIGIKQSNSFYDKHTSKKHFQRNGAIFLAKTELIEQGKLWDDMAYKFEMPLSRSIDIDDMDDMYIAEALLEKRILGGQQ